MGKSEPSIQIDLNEFKLHLHLKNKTQRTFHFDSPSRRFYLSVIALVVNEMKKRGEITSIPILQHLDLLALVNESIGGGAGSSDKEHLLPRIYRKWKGALPNLEEAPLFKVLGKKREDEDGATGKVYSFTDAEKDDWANLFEYIGSEENVRLKFATDKVGVSLDETSIIFGDLLNGDAWDRFISSVKRDGAGTTEPPEPPEPAEAGAIPEEAPLPASVAPQGKFDRLVRNRWGMLAAVVVIMAGAWTIWKNYLSPGIRVPSVSRIQNHLPDKPSIAVLPFVNLSEDPKQEYFSDGITEDIITNLAAVSGLAVVSRNSTFVYKGKTIKTEEVATDLGVRHVLEGSVRREDGRVRITAQLIDGSTGHHVWADKYDRELKEIFSVQDEVARKVVSELAVALTTTETERLPRRHTKNFEAYDTYLRARRESYIIRKENHLKAIDLSRQVINLDPNFAGGYSYLSFLLNRGVRQGWSVSPREDLEQAFHLARKAIAVDDAFPLAYTSLANAYLAQGKHDDAVVAAEKAASLVPGDAMTIKWLGYYLHWAGRGEEAVVALKKSIEMDPIGSLRDQGYLDFLSWACFTAGRYEESISNMKRAIEKFGPIQTRDPWLIASYSMLGRMEEAREAAQQWLKADPTFSLSSWNFGRTYKRAEDRERLYGALRKAGLK